MLPKEAYQHLLKITIRIRFSLKPNTIKITYKFTNWRTSINLLTAHKNQLNLIYQTTTILKVSKVNTIFSNR